MKRVDCTEQTLRGGVQLRAFFREAETGASAVTQAQTKACLQLRHVFADARCTDVENRLRRGEATASHDGFEDPQQLEIRVLNLHRAAPRLLRELPKCVS
jgi:hypothetical protein